MKLPHETSFQIEWESFKKTIYPDGMSREQEKQVYRAFLSGSLSMITFIQLLADYPDENAVALLERMRKEIDQKAVEVIGTIEKRN